MKYLILLISFIFNTVIASDKALPTRYKQAGKIVSVEIVIGEPVKIYVVGREEAKLDLSKLEFTIKRLSPKPQMLTLKSQNDYFILDESLNSKKPIDLEVKTKIDNESEVLKFRIDSHLK